MLLNIVLAQRYFPVRRIKNTWCHSLRNLLAWVSWVFVLFPFSSPQKPYEMSHRWQTNHAQAWQNVWVVKYTTLQRSKSGTFCEVYTRHDRRLLASSNLTNNRIVGRSLVTHIHQRKHSGTLLVTQQRTFQLWPLLLTWSHKQLMLLSPLLVARFVFNWHWTEVEIANDLANQNCLLETLLET